MTWVSTVNLIMLAGATPVFADVDRDTLVVTASSIERCITPRTRLIVPVHFAGGAADLAPIRSLAAEHGVAADRGRGARDRRPASADEPVGRRGTAIFSFHPIKNITTGEGGMVCSDDERPARARSAALRFHGLGVDAWDRTTQGRAPQAEVHGAGLQVQPHRHRRGARHRTAGPARRAHRKRRRCWPRPTASGWHDLAAILPLEIPPGTTRHAWSLYVVRLDNARSGIDRDELMERLKQRNIGTGLHFRAGASARVLPDASRALAR